MRRSVRSGALPAVLTDYWDASRAPRYSILLALPLLLMYEGLAAFLSTGHGAELRNGADVLLQELFLTVAGRRYAPLVFGITVIGLSIWYIARDVRNTRAPLRPGVFLGMLAEAALLALCFGSIVGTVTAHVISVVPHRSVADVTAAPAMASIAAPTVARTVAVAAPWGHGPAGGIPSGGVIADAPTATKVMLALGAGVYEELVFRVLLVSLIAFVARRLLGWRPLVATGAAVAISALIFAVFHYVGPYGDAWRLDSFVFRLIGGLAFSLLYVTRGFGITAWTHALYDLLVLVA